MKDRVPKYPGRVIITPTGKANEYDIVRADEPMEPGSAYNKGNVLPDEVCDNLGLDRVRSEPKDAFNTLAMRPAPPGAYNSDLFLYLSGRHPVLNAGDYNDYWKYDFWERKNELARDVELTGNAQTITVYDGGNV